MRDNNQSVVGMGDVPWLQQEIGLNLWDIRFRGERLIYQVESSTAVCTFWKIQTLMLIYGTKYTFVTMGKNQLNAFTTGLGMKNGMTASGNRQVTTS